MPPATQTRRILIKVDTSDSKGLNEIAGKMGQLNKSVKTLSNDMGFLTDAFRTYLGFLGVRELASLSDRMQNFSNTLKITTGNSEAAAEALEKINIVATQTNQSVTDVGQVFNRLALSMRGTGATTNEVLDLTKTLINSFRVAGATATETSNTIIQLSQAFSSGELRGQELRSVLEQNAVIAGILREKYGADLFKKAEQGAIKLKDVLTLLAQNQDLINKQAQELVPTFEQGLTRAMNELALAVGKVNQEFNLSGNFFKAIEFILDNKEEILTAIGVMALSAIPALTASIISLNAAIAANPIVATAIAIGTLTYAIIQLGGGVKNMVVEFVLLGKVIGAAINDIIQFFNYLPAKLLGGPFEEFQESLRKGREQVGNEIGAVRDELKKQNIEDEMNKLLGPQLDPNAGGLNTLIKKLPEGVAKIKKEKIKDVLAGINKEFASGAIDLQQYNNRIVDFQLYKLNREFKEGKKDLVAYKEELSKLNIQSFNRDLAEGKINMNEFNEAIDAEKVSVLNAKLETGRISLAEYNKELIKTQEILSSETFSVGLNDYIDSLGSFSSNIAGVITDSFKSLEDNFVEFAKTGKLEFKDLSNSIISDLTRIIVKATIMRAITGGVNALLGGSGIDPSAFGGSGPGQTPNMGFAKGGAFANGNVVPFASGGVVDSPTTFAFGGNKTGLMGEAGPEAILPLQRAGNGDLGVKATVTPVTINVINNAGVDVQQTETTGPDGQKQIDLIVTQKVRDGIASGKFDSVMKQSFGVTRRGVG